MMWKETCGLLFQPCRKHFAFLTTARIPVQLRSMNPWAPFPVTCTITEM